MITISRYNTSFQAFEDHHCLLFDSVDTISYSSVSYTDEITFHFIDLRIHDNDSSKLKTFLTTIELDYEGGYFWKEK